MIFFDRTKTGGARHRSGLTRVSARLRQELGDAARDAAWNPRPAQIESPAGVPRADDWFLSPELFSEDERPGFSAFIASRACRTAAIFHDAIPLKHPHITWPQSVARHPGYMKLLSRFSRVWAVSASSRDELRGFWRWQGVADPPPIEVLPLGADFDGSPRVTSRSVRSAAIPQLLCVGILEPRKNQAFLLDVCEDLWTEGLRFELHLIGRVNPHFGAPIVDRIKSLRRTRGDQVHFHAAADDATVARHYAAAHVTVFPTLAEGCGLPLLESLWRGVPCVCSDLRPLRENADAGGCLIVAANDHAAWKAALRRVVTDRSLVDQLTAEATSRPLPTWRDAAQTLAAALAD